MNRQAQLDLFGSLRAPGPGQRSQPSLFGSVQVLTNRYLASLERLDLEGATAALAELARRGTQPGPLTVQVATLAQFTARYAQLARGEAAERAQALLDLADDAAWEGLADARSALGAGLVREAAQALSLAATTYLRPDLHPAEVFLRAGHEQAAQRCAENGLAAVGEDARLRHVLAYLHSRAGRDDLALVHLGHALFHDPGRCRVALLAPADVRSCWRDLRHTCGDDAGAWMELPFALWRRGRLSVPAADTAFRAHLEGLLARAECGSDGASPPPRLTFIRALCCAEGVRLTGGDHATMVSLRARLRGLDAAWFAEYMATLAQGGPTCRLQAPPIS